MKARKAACLLVRGSQVRILPGAKEKALGIGALPLSGQATLYGRWQRRWQPPLPGTKSAAALIEALERDEEVVDLGSDASIAQRNDAREERFDCRTSCHHAALLGQYWASPRAL